MQRLVFIALAILAYFYIKSLFRREPPLSGTDEMVEDPACGVYVPKGNATQRTIDGKRFFFCGPRCAENYEKKKSTGKG